MASVEVSQLSDLQKSTLALSYAALLCNSGEVEFNADNAEHLLKAAGVKAHHHEIEAFVKALEGQKISDMLTCGGGAGGSASAGGATGGATNAPAKQAEPEKEEEEEEEGDLGMDMFGF